MSVEGIRVYIAKIEDVRAPPPGPLQRGVVPLTSYRGMSLTLLFRLRESSNPRPKGHIEMGSTLTTNWATEKRNFFFEQKILMGYRPFCIVRKEILCCNIEIVLQAVGENAEKLYCNIVLYCDLKG